MTSHKVRFIEFSCGVESDEIEICEMLLKEKLVEAPENFHYIFVCGGDRKGLDVLGRLLEHFSMTVLYTLFYGNSKVRDEDKYCFYIAVAFLCNEGSFDILNVDEDSLLDLEYVLDDPSSRPRRFLNELERLKGATQKPGFDSLERALEGLASVTTEIDDSLLRVSLSKAAKLVERLIRLESRITKGEGDGTYGELARVSWKNQFETSYFQSIFDQYKGLLSEDLIGAQAVVDGWLNYFKTGLNAASILKRQVINQDIPVAYVWFARYALIKAIRQSRDGEYAAGLALCIRALELFCLVIAINTGKVEYDSAEKLVFTGSGQRVSGVGPLLGELNEDLQRELGVDVMRDVWTTIEIRNSTIFGHGIRFGNKDVFDFVYRTVVKAYSLSKYTNPPHKTTWDDLVNMSNMTVRKVACELLLESTISNTARAR